MFTVQDCAYRPNNFMQYTQIGRVCISDDTLSMSESSSFIASLLKAFNHIGHKDGTGLVVLVPTAALPCMFTAIRLYNMYKHTNTDFDYDYQSNSGKFHRADVYGLPGIDIDRYGNTTITIVGSGMRYLVNIKINPPASQITNN